MGGCGCTKVAEVAQSDTTWISFPALPPKSHCVTLDNGLRLVIYVSTSLTVKWFFAETLLREYMESTGTYVLALEPTG